MKKILACLKKYWVLIVWVTLGVVEFCLIFTLKPQYTHAFNVINIVFAGILIAITIAVVMVRKRHKKKE